MTGPALLLVLKALYDLSDTQAADALKFDLRWKVWWTRRCPLRRLTYTALRAVLNRV